MKTMNYLIIVSISILAVSCSKVTEPVKKIGLGSRVIDYQDDDQVDSLIIPPDLTKPSFQGKFSETLQTNNSIIVDKIETVEVMRDNHRKWLLVELTPNEVWFKAKEFFRSYGFKIEKENQKLGILETDYLEIETVVPDKSLGVIRATLSKALKTQYGLPRADKYRIRVEPTNSINKTEVYLTLTSIEEVVSGTQRLWQSSNKDTELETEMLLSFMIFLGSDIENAIEKIQATDQASQIIVSVEEASNGFANLVFPYNKKQTWGYLGWALDELGVDVEDRDSISGNYYINVPLKKGLFARLLRTSSDTVTYKLIIKQVDEIYSQVIISELSGQDEQKTIDFSFEFFEKIVSKF